MNKTWLKRLPVDYQDNVALREVALSVIIGGMESDSLKLMRAREAELSQEILRLQELLGPLQAEREQVRIAIRAMLGEIIPKSGLAESNRSLAHYRRRAHPEVQGLTLKQLVLKALREENLRGATANELLATFESLWGKEVARTSLSPQLSRLKSEGKIKLSGKVWHLANENGEAEASPTDEGIALPSSVEPSSGEQPTQDGSVPAKEEKL